MDSSEARYLRFRRLRGTPGNVDIVNVYRPEDEIEAIVERHALPLSASVLWLQPPSICDRARHIAGQHGFAFIEGIDIAETARSLSG
jgi:predicted CoA-binding protein